MSENLNPIVLEVEEVRVINAVSPTVDLERVEDGASVTVHDYRGTQNVVIYDGPVGPVGPQGPQGESGAETAKAIVEEAISRMADSIAEAQAIGTTVAGYRDSAATSAASASASETAAGVSASAASASETAASQSASNAAVSERNADSSASAAHTSETNAAQSATAAAGSATAAHTSEVNAGNSATASAGSATAAAGSASQAQAVLDSIPEDYTELSEDVTSLKSALNDQYDPVNITVESGRYTISSSRKVQPNSNDSWERSHITGIAEGEKYRINTISYGSLCYGIIFAQLVRNDYVVVEPPYEMPGVSADTPINKTYTVPQGATDLFINCHSTNSSAISVSRVRIDKVEKEVTELQNAITSTNLLSFSDAIALHSGDDLDNLTSCGVWTIGSGAMSGVANFPVTELTSSDSAIVYNIADSSRTIEQRVNFKIHKYWYYRKYYNNAFHDWQRVALKSDIDVIEPIFETDGLSRMRILAVNCGAFDYPTSGTRLTGEQYKKNWRKMLNDTEADMFALSDYTDTFEDLQETSDVVLFGNTLNNFLKKPDGTDRSLRLANRTNAVFIREVNIYPEVQSGTRRFAHVFRFSLLDKQVYLYVVHCWPGAGNESIRAIEYNHLIQDAEEQNYEYVIFAGDFNAQNISEYAPFLQNYNLCNGGYTGTHYTLRGNVTADNIIYSKNLIELNFQVIEDDTLNTDHYPIMATLQIKH